MFLREFYSTMFTGISSRSSPMLQGSPEPAVDGSSGFISVQYIKSFPPNESNMANPPDVKCVSLVNGYGLLNITFQVFLV